MKAFFASRDPRADNLSLPEAERAAWAANGRGPGGSPHGGRFRAIRCGRRWGKTELGKVLVADTSIKGKPAGWFAPSYKYLTEVYEQTIDLLKPVVAKSNKTDGVIRLITGGQIDFWTLEDERAGRSRKYKRVFVDEAAFTKSNAFDIWDKSIQPTLLDYGGEAWLGSNTNGVDPENFLYKVCHEPKHGFVTFHAPSINNPTIPERSVGETDEEHYARRLAALEVLRARNHPLVFSQEYEAEFVDWSGVAFFSKDKLLGEGGRGVPFPAQVETVYATIDSATKTGRDNDGTACCYWAKVRNSWGGFHLVLLDWDLVQIEGALLEHWLPGVMSRGVALATQLRARGGWGGAWIEDKDSGQVLLQQALRRGLAVQPIDSKLTSLGKDERAISVSGYVHRGEVLVSDAAYDKVLEFKGSTRNHLMAQVLGFRVGDKDAAKRADDLLDAFCYGISMGLGNMGGW